MSENHDSRRSAALFGTGRNGSTWLGAIINSHPATVYRFEPFARLREEPAIGRVVESSRDRTLTDEHVLAAISVLRRASPLTDKPPFFAKENDQMLGKPYLWPFFRRVRSLDRLYARLYTPDERALLVFKEVNHEAILEGITRLSAMPVLYLIRSPFAVVASVVYGQAHGLLPTGRLGVLESLLEKHAPALAEEFKPRLPGLSSVGRNALLWRIDAERGIRAVDAYSGGMIVTYEKLCLDPVEQARRAFAFLGLDMPEQCLRFVERSTSAPSRAGRPGWLKRTGYFTVFRRPQDSMTRWKSRLTGSQIREIEQCVASSQVTRRFRDEGVWE